MSFVANRAAALQRPEPSGDVEGRFRALVQSPLRAGLLRFLSARPEETFDVESLMSTFGRMRLDVDNCLNELVEFGVVRHVPGPPARYGSQRPERDASAQLLDAFLE